MARRFGRLPALACATLNVAGAGVRLATVALGARVAPGRFADARDRHRGYLRMHLTGLRP